MALFTLWTTGSRIFVLCCVLGFDILLSSNAWIRPCALHNCFRIRWTWSHTMIDNHNPSTAAKWSAMLMTRTKRIIRKKLLTRKKTKRKRCNSMTTEFRRNVPKKWSLRCSKTEWNKNQPGFTVEIWTSTWSYVSINRYHKAIFSFLDRMVLFLSSLGLFFFLFFYQRLLIFPRAKIFPWEQSFHVWIL